MEPQRLSGISCRNRAGVHFSSAYQAQVKYEQVQNLLELVLELD